jgi:hypothetical protein
MQNLMNIVYQLFDFNKYLLQKYDFYRFFYELHKIHIKIEI